MSEARMPEMAAYQRNIDKMNALLAENARLREALERIAAGDLTHSQYAVLARQEAVLALAEGRGA